MDSSKAFLKVKDHTVSGEDFELLYNQRCRCLETIPQPSESDLPSYYKSDDYISHTDSKRNLFEKAYHIVRNISLKRKLKLIKSFASTGNTLLDIGCGTGDFLAVAKNHGWDVSGVEPNDKAREIANSKTNNTVYNSAALFDFSEESFDVITLWHVLEHLPRLEDHLSQLKKLIKPEGVIIIAVPNYKSHDAAYYKNYWAAYDVPRHLWHFSRESIKWMFKNINMGVVKILPMKFDAYYVSLLSEKYKTGKMRYINAIWRGWQSNAKARRSGEYSSLIYIIKNN